MTEFKQYVRFNVTSNPTTEYLREFVKKTEKMNEDEKLELAKKYVQPIIVCGYTNKISLKEIIDALSVFSKEEKDIFVLAMADRLFDLIY